MFNELVGESVTVENCEMRYALINGHWSKTVDRKSVETDKYILDITDALGLIKKYMKAVVDEFEQNYYFEMYNAETGELLFKIYLDDDYSVKVEKF